MAGLYSRYIKPIYFIGDLLSIAASYVFCFLLTNHNLTEAFSISQLTLFFIATISWYIAVFFFRTYTIDNRNSKNLTILSNLIKVAVLQLLLTETTLAIFFHNSFSTRYFVFLQQGLLLLFSIVWRATLFYTLRIYRKRGFNYRKIIIAGIDENAKDLSAFFSTNTEFAYRFLGFFERKNYNGHEVAHDFDELESYCKKNEIDEIFCTTSRLTSSELQGIIDFGENNLIRIKFIPGSTLLQYDPSKVEFYGQTPIVNLRTIPLDNKLNKFLKRLFDILFSIGVIVLLLSWLLPVLAILIKIGTKGPVFFLQKRSGIRNKDFKCIKLRTMVVNLQADDLQAKRNDARITKLGKFLRRYSIDELPQFFNVLFSDMAVVGPRPHMIKHTEEYASLINKYMVRHLIKPGITGLSQSKGLRGETNDTSLMRNRIKVDIFYIENWSFSLDIKIIIQTLIQIFKGNDSL